MKFPRLVLRKILTLIVFSVILLSSTQYFLPDTSASFPGINGKISYDKRITSFSDRDVLTMNPIGTRQTNISNDPGFFDGDGSWTADGSKIAFESNRDGASRQIYVMNADGTGQTNISGNNGFNDGGPTWSPDGTKIAFERDVTGFRDIFVMNAADGTGVTNLSNEAATVFNGNPSWSPDGTKIVYNRGTEIFTMSAVDGSGKTNLGIGSNPDWSPDGTKIVFDTGGQIFTMSAVDGSGKTNISNNAFFESNPNWSPDGTKIVFDTTRDGNREIYVMNAADGSSPTNLTMTPNDTESRPHWQPLTMIAVGGSFVPIDTTTLLVAGAQMTSAWMIPIIVAGIGFAIVIARKF